MKKTSLLISILFCLFFSCQKEVSDLEFEQRVMYQVFSKVLDSVYRDRKLIIPPPPKNFKEQLREYNDELAIYKKDTSKRVIIIDDNVRGFYLDNKLKNPLKDFEMPTDTLSFSKSYKFDISRIDTKKHEFKYRSAFPENDYLIWEEKNYNYHLSGEISVSRIIFDKFKERGFFNCSYICGMKAGMGYYVYIKKDKGNWVIDKIENIWIS